MARLRHPNCCLFMGYAETNVGDKFSKPNVGGIAILTELCRGSLFQLTCAGLSLGRLVRLLRLAAVVHGQRPASTRTSLYGCCCRRG